jgi:CheY-like chemotaxis protein
VLAPVIQEALKLVRIAVPGSVELRCEAATDRMVLANEGQIHQIVLNLCTNAAQAMGERGGVIRLALTEETISEAAARGRPPLRRGDYLKLEVRDNGNGMDAATLERIYEPFFTTKPVGQGTGLGLAVVHGIVQAHDGAIFVESTPGLGTAFSIYLPAASERSGAVDGCNNGETPGDGEKVLFVDDEPSVARIGERLLERLGYTAVALTDPVAARDRLVNDPDGFDLVITDYLMPRMTGVDLAKAVWGVRPGLPVILAVGFGGQLDATKARALGFGGFIAKPFTLQALSGAISAALATR